MSVTVIQTVALPAGKDFLPRRCGDSAEIRELSGEIFLGCRHIVPGVAWPCGIHRLFFQRLNRSEYSEVIVTRCRTCL
jgi:hypothetical protein